MLSDSQLKFENGYDADALRLQQLQLEAKAARLEAEAKALEAKIEARKFAAQRMTPPRDLPPPPPAAKLELPPALPVPQPPPPPAPPAKKAIVKPLANGHHPTAKQVPKPQPSAPAVPVTRQPPSPESPQTKAEVPKPTVEPIPAIEIEAKPTPGPQVTAKGDRHPGPSPALSPKPNPVPSTASTPVATPAAAESADSEEEPATDESGCGRFSRLLSTTPSYLVSAVFHLVALLILALIMLPPPQDLIKQLVINASALDEQEEELNEVVIETLDQQLEQMEIIEPMVAEAIDVADPGAADLGAIAQDIQAEVSTTGVAMNDTDIDTIGTLFGTDGKGMADSNDGAGGAEFFGVKASGRKFVFIVDSSLSMKNGKFEAACEELMYSISRLSKDQYFYVLFFDHDAAKMTFAGKKQPEPRCVPATSPNIVSVGNWVKTVELEGRTDPYDCVEFALTLYPDAIYILTDGKFTDGGKTVKYLKKENLYNDPIDGIRPKAIIHTVGFYQRDGEETLIPLAKTHGGDYRFVPPPAGKKKK